MTRSAVEATISVMTVITAVFGRDTITEWTPAFGWKGDVLRLVF